MSTVILVVYCSLSLLEAAPISDGALTSSGAYSSEGIGLGNDPTDEKIGENEIIFEGDIEISIEDILKYYDIDEVAKNELESLVSSHDEGNNVRKRAARNDEDKMWTDKTVPYAISSRFSLSERRNIIAAMAIWSQETCLNFVRRVDQRDYIYFFKNDDSCSSHVGRNGGSQYIRLTSYCARSQGKILHELGHALGLWHEQSRPDRDSYVTILWDNIVEKYRHNFRKQRDKVIDYQGTGYDYGSVMHYGTKYFTSCSNCNTITVTNETEYEKQGQPMLGQEIGLSLSDIIQINRLYNCPAPGEKGLLTIFIRNGSILNLPSTIPEGSSTTANVSIKVTAVTSSGTRHTRETFTVSATESLTWNEQLIFPRGEWQFFRVQSKTDRFLTGMSVTVPLLNKTRNSTDRKYCNNTNCDTSVSYDYSIIQEGRLLVQALRADIPCSETRETSQPYMKIVAHDRDGGSVERRTLAVKHTHHPQWNQEFDFGVRVWSRFDVSVWGEETSGGDFRLSRVQTYLLPGSEIVSEQKLSFLADDQEGGSVVLSYSYY